MVCGSLYRNNQKKKHQATPQKKKNLKKPTNGFIGDVHETLHGVGGAPGGDGPRVEHYGRVAQAEAGAVQGLGKKGEPGVAVEADQGQQRQSGIMNK